MTEDKTNVNDTAAARDDHEAPLDRRDIEILLLLRVATSALRIRDQVDPSLARRLKSLPAFIDASAAVLDELGYGDS